MIKKILSNILICIVVIISSYLLVANIIHMVYLNQYGVYDFNDEKFVEYKNKLNTLDNNADKLKNTKLNFKDEDLERLINYTDNILNAIKSNKLLDYEGEQRFYLKDIYKIEFADLTSEVSVSTLLSILNILVEYDESLKSYRDLMMTVWPSKMFDSNERINLPLTASYYMIVNDINDSTGPSMNIRASVYNLMNNIEELNYMYELIMKVGNSNEE